MRVKLQKQLKTEDSSKELFLGPTNVQFDADMEREIKNLAELMITKFKQYRSGGNDGAASAL